MAELGKKILKTSPVGYAAVKAVERKNDPEHQAEKDAETTAKPQAAEAIEAAGQPSATPMRLQPGEKIIVDVLPSKWWTLGLYIFTFGAWAVWRQRHRFIVTNQRVVVTKGIVSKSERSAPLGRIQDAQLHRSPLSGGKVLLSTAGGPLGVDSVGPLTQADALRFADALNRLIGTGGGGVGAMAAPSAADEIAKLAELRDKGVLTVEEFEAKKAELLERM